MTREEKTAKKLARAARRREKQRKRTYVDYHAVPSGVPTWAARQWAKSRYGTSWVDPNSPTGRSQICDYMGTCQAPCNGDC